VVQSRASLPIACRLFIILREKGMFVNLSVQLMQCVELVERLRLVK